MYEKDIILSYLSESLGRLQKKKNTIYIMDLNLSETIQIQFFSGSRIDDEGPVVFYISWVLCTWILPSHFTIFENFLDVVKDNII